LQRKSSTGNRRNNSQCFNGAAKRFRAGVLAAKMGDRRRHFLHVMSPGLVRHYGEIYIDVDPKKLVKTRMAKSVHDAGWPMLPQHAVVQVDCDWGVMRIVPSGAVPKRARFVGAFPRAARRGWARLA
jgi:hypothetical protein